MFTSFTINGCESQYRYNITLYIIILTVAQNIKVCPNHYKLLYIYNIVVDHTICPGPLPVWLPILIYNIYNLHRMPSTVTGRPLPSN